MYYGIDQLSDCSYLIKKPLADKMNADTGHNGWLVLEAHGGQVQTATTRHLSLLHLQENNSKSKNLYLLVAMK